mgnify:CR=1 FL=1
MVKKHRDTNNKNNVSLIENHKLLWDISLVLLGVILGFVVSAGYQSYQTYQEDTAIARSIYKEIGDPYNRIVIFKLQLKNDSVSIPDTPFYPETSIFPQVLTQTERFDKTLIDNLTAYENALAVAEEMRQKLEEDAKIKKSPNGNMSIYDEYINQSAAENYLRMMRHVDYCYNQIPIIKKQLSDNYRI